MGHPAAGLLKSAGKAADCQGIEDKGLWTKTFGNRTGKN